MSTRDTFEEHVRAIDLAVAAVRGTRCGCDPQDVAGMVPGEACPVCGNFRERWPHQTAMVFLDDARRDLRVAEQLVDKAMVADGDEDLSRRTHALDEAAEFARRATNAITFAAASLNEEGRTATGMAGAHDQDR